MSVIVPNGSKLSSYLHKSEAGKRKRVSHGI
jgi:hypothetical protein